MTTMLSDEIRERLMIGGSLTPSESCALVMEIDHLRAELEVQVAFSKAAGELCVQLEAELKAKQEECQDKTEVLRWYAAKRHYTEYHAPKIDSEYGYFYDDGDKAQVCLQRWEKKE